MKRKLRKSIKIIIWGMCITILSFLLCIGGLLMWSEEHHRVNTGVTIYE
jgi:TRAP-type C4-dicarboxylate transport system permease small subunit